MALILEISPEAEARIRMNAAVRGQDVIEYILAFTENDQAIDLSEFEDRADFEDSVAGIRAGLSDLEAERTYSLEETFAHAEAHLNEWERRQRESITHQEKAA